MCQVVLRSAEMDHMDHIPLRPIGSYITPVLHSTSTQCITGTYGSAKAAAGWVRDIELACGPMAISVRHAPGPWSSPPPAPGMAWSGKRMPICAAGAEYLHRGERESGKRVGE